MKILNKVTLATKLSFLMLCVAFSFAFVQEANERKMADQESQNKVEADLEESSDRIAILDAKGEVQYQ